MDEKQELRHRYLLAHAARLVQIMHQLNLVDEYALVVDSPVNGGTPYHHLDRGLIATLRLLGTENKTGFYEGLTSGMGLQEALDNAIKHEDG